MDQQEFVKDGEGGARDTFVIVLAVKRDDIDRLMEESQTFKSIVIDWHAARGNDAGKVCLAVLSDAKYHNAIKELFEGLHAMELDLRPVFKAVPFELTLHDLQGAPVNTFNFLPG